MQESHVWLGPKSHAYRPYTPVMRMKDYLFGCLQRRGRRRLPFRWRLGRAVCIFIFLVVILGGGYLMSEYRASLCSDEEDQSVFYEMVGESSWLTQTCTLVPY